MINIKYKRTNSQVISSFVLIFVLLLGVQSICGETDPNVAAGLAAIEPRGVVSPSADANVISSDVNQSSPAPAANADVNLVSPNAGESSAVAAPVPAPLPDANKPQRITNVRVEGNVIFKETEIITKVRTRPGDMFDAAAAAEDTKRVAGMAGVEYCYYNIKPAEGGVELTFVVVEKNIIRSIDFTGNKAYNSKKLREKLGFKVGDYLDSVLAQTYTTTITEFYRKNGFPYTEVTLDTGKLSTGKVVYTVNEGPRVKIESVKFSGNSALKSGALKKVIKTKTRSWVIMQKYYQEEELVEDVSRLQKAYQRKGFLSVKIDLQRQFNADKTKVRIVFAIEEGPAYRVDDVVFTGNKEYDKQKLSGLLTLTSGQTYNEQKAEADTKQITKLYRENGFIDAKVERSIKFLSDKTVAVEYATKEGQQFRIGQITITGNELTKDRVVRHVLDEYDFKPGKLYNADTAKGDGKGELEKTLQQTLVTERDGATITPAGQTPGQRDAQVSVIEGKTGMIMLGAGVSTDSGLMGQLTYEQRNFDISDRPKSFEDFATGKAFRGGGQTLRISAQPGTEVSEYSISFTEPYLNDKPVTLNVVGSDWERWRESYNEHRTKGFVGLEKRRPDKWRYGIGFRAENVNVGEVDNDAPKEIKDYEGGNLLGGVRLGVGRDLTDNRANPTTGRNFEASYEQVSGDSTFGIASGTYKRYYTLYEDLAERKTVLATKLLAASVVGDAPPFEKFYGGGTGTYGIRGFKYRGVSTRGLQTNKVDPKRKDPIGSDWIFLANAEAAVPFLSDNMALLFFIDSGAIDSGDYRVGAGTGIQLMLPQWFGPVPMRFELATPLMKSEGDQTQIFSFSVGALF